MRASAAEGRALDAEARNRAQQGELARAEAACAGAEERAEGAAAAAAQWKEQAASLRCQVTTRSAELDTQLQVGISPPPLSLALAGIVKKL
jgi:hypothetical protein